MQIATTAIDKTVSIVSAFLSNNILPAADVPGLISNVHRAVTELDNPTPAPEPQREPDAITCLECGSKHKMLKRHLLSAHDMSPDEYRARWHLPRDYPGGNIL